MSGPSPALHRRIALPVVGGEAPIRRSRAGRLRAAVLIGVHLLIAVHLIHWWAQGTTLSPLEPAEGMELAKRGVVNAGLLLFAAAGLATAVFGRFFCGWGCHVVALQDLCQWLLRRIGIRPRPLRSRWLAWVPVLAFVYMFLWPAMLRALRSGEPPALRVELRTADFWATFPGWGVGTVTFLVCGFLIVYLLGAKGFCTYACPYGALFGAADRLAAGRIRVSDACNACGHCTAVCTSNVRVYEEVRDWGMVVDPGCVKCLDCVSVCPTDALRFGLGRPAIGARPRVAHVRQRTAALSWREELLLVASFAVALFAWRGLYGLVPFLLALGWAACLAYLTWTVGQLASAQDLALRRVQLRRAGRLTHAGAAWLGTYTLLAALTLHSAAVQGALLLGGLGERHTALYRERVLAGGDLPAIPGAEAERAREALSRLELANRWGLLRQPGLALRMAWLALVADDPDRLGRFAQAALAEPGQASSAWLLVGHRHELGGRHGRAADAYRQAVAAAPSSPAGHLRLGLLLARDGDLKAARTAFEEGLEGAGANADLSYNRALVLGMSGDPEGAIDGFRHVLALQPRHRPSRENLAALLAQLGRHGESAAELTAAVELAPGETRLRLWLERELAAASAESAGH